MTTAEKPPVLLRTSRAAELLGVTRSTIHRWVDNGQLEPWSVVDGQYLFDAEFIHQLAAVAPPRQRKPRPTD